METTDINQIRTMAIAYALEPIEHNKKFDYPFHPFLHASVAIILTESGKKEIVNVLEGDGENRFRNFIIHQLQDTDKAIDIFCMLNHRYHFIFLKNIHKYLSDDDLGRCLQYVWLSRESPYDNSVFTARQLARLFRRSSKNTLMHEDELSAFQELPERITVYRVNSLENSKDIVVFPWTLSREMAEGIASFYNNDEMCVFQAELPKAGVLAYYDEETIVADPYKLENIKQAD